MAETPDFNSSAERRARFGKVFAPRVEKLEQMVLAEYLPEHFDAHVTSLLPMLKNKATALCYLTCLGPWARSP